MTIKEQLGTTTLKKDRALLGTNP